MSFPITSRVTTLDNLPAGSETMHSIVRGRNDYDLPDPPAVGTPEFDEQVETFLHCRQDVVQGIWPDWYFERLNIDPEPPEMFAQFGVTRDNPHAATVLVDHKMDDPGDLHRAFVDYHGNPPLKQTQDDRSPEQAGHDFLGARWLDTQIAVNIYDALVEAFQAKYYFVGTRPEHYFQAGLLVAEYSCPPHPSDPAGHGAIAGATFETWEQLTDIEPGAGLTNWTAAQHYAHYRTFAGVHWARDNTAGFNLGRMKTEARYG